MIEDQIDPLERLDHMEDPVLLVNANTFKIIKGSPPAIDQFGYSQEEISNLSLLDCLVKFDESSLKQSSPLYSIRPDHSLP